MHDDLDASRTPLGDAGRVIRLGVWTIRVHGLSNALAVEADRRWGGFVTAGETGSERLRLQLVRGERSSFLPRWRPGEPYRVVRDAGEGGPVLRSYNFLAGASNDPASWWVAMDENGGEPPGRVLENVLRCLAARLAVEAGGVAFHGAGVVRGGPAFVFVGPSNAGKTTLVSMSRPCTSLGDDFAVVLPGQDGWVTTALPFDNSEEAPAAPPEGLYPVAGIFRLFQAGRAHLETPPEPLRVASMLACAALSDTIPEHAGRLLANARAVASDVPYGHLHFRKDPGFWDLLERRA